LITKSNPSVLKGACRSQPSQNEKQKKAIDEPGFKGSVAKPKRRIGKIFHVFGTFLHKALDLNPTEKIGALCSEKKTASLCGK
jgi:hypothetical protein